MSLLGPVYVYSQLTLPESVRLAIVKLAVDSGRTAAALEAIVAKLNEPDGPPTPVDTELHEAIVEQTGAADALQTAAEQQSP